MFGPDAMDRQHSPSSSTAKQASFWARTSVRQDYDRRQRLRARADQPVRDAGYGAARIFNANQQWPRLDQWKIHCPQQNGMVERVIRTLREQCIHRQRFDNIQQATRAIGDWISFYDHRCPDLALAMRTPAEAFNLATEPEQIPLGQYTHSHLTVRAPKSPTPWHSGRTATSEECAGSGEIPEQHGS